MGITVVGNTRVEGHHRASCHCGGVELRIHLPDGIVDPRRCDCSMCRRRGAIAATAALEAIEVVRGGDLLRRYQFNTHVAEHWFCGVCGIHTHHRRRSNPNEYGYNVGCLDGVDPFALGPVPTSDGVHHPCDRATGGSAQGT